MTYRNIFDKISFLLSRILGSGKKPGLVCTRATGVTSSFLGKFCYPSWSKLLDSQKYFTGIFGIQKTPRLARNSVEWNEGNHPIVAIARHSAKNFVREFIMIPNGRQNLSHTYFHDLHSSKDSKCGILVRGNYPWVIFDYPLHEFGKKIHNEVI